MNAEYIKAEQQLELWFDKYVPIEGKCSTVGGEMVRALMRIIYRSWNDGDSFSLGYGVETCGSDALFLKEKLFDIASNSDNEKTVQLCKKAQNELTLLEGKQYECYQLNGLVITIVDILKNDSELFTIVNECDSRTEYCDQAMEMWDSDYDDCDEEYED